MPEGYASGGRVAILRRTVAADSACRFVKVACLIRGNEVLKGSILANAFRNCAAVIVALIVALIQVILVELWSAVVHPLPPDFGETMDEMCQHVADYPDWVLAVVVPAWGFSVFLSTWIARRIGSRGAAIFTGVLLLAAVLFNISMLPYPIWFKIVMPIAILPAIVLGSRLPTRQGPSDGDRPT